MTRQRVVVTGMGVIAPDHLNREAFFQTITSGTSGIRYNEMLQRLGVRSHVAGGVDIPYSELHVPEDEEKTIKMAYSAIDEAMEDSGLNIKDMDSLGTRGGLSISTCVTGQSRIYKYIQNKKEKKQNSPKWLIDIPSFTTQLAAHTSIGGPIYTTMSACAAGTAAAGIALDMIRNETVDLMIVVGTEAIIENSVAGFHSLQAMSIKECKPFDKERSGMTLGEGAAAFIVESLERARKRRAHIYGELLGYGLGNDAFHITSPDPEGEGAFRTMRMALDDAGLNIDEIDYINAHGTGTLHNDTMEIRAISKLFERIGRPPEVMISSTKSITGHCLGAAGSLELAVSLLAVDRDTAPPTVFLNQPSEEFFGFRILKGKSVQQKIKYAMSNSFAFSGNSASIIVGKME